MADGRRKLRPDECPNGFDVRRIVRASGDQGGSHEKGYAGSREPPRVFEDDVVRLSGEPPVDSGIHVLDVEDDEVDVGERSNGVVPGEYSAGFDRYGDSGGSAERCAFREEIRLLKRFASRKRHAPSGTTLERRVAKRRITHIFRTHERAEDAARLVRASVDALSAPRARISVRDASFTRGAGQSERADGDADAASGAAVGEDADFRSLVLGLGIAAPRASQRTSLEEENGADSGAVVQRPSLDVEDEAPNGCGIRRACAYVAR